MSSLQVGPLLRFTVGCALLVAVAYVVIGPSGDSPDPPPTAASTTSAPAPAPVFGALPTTGTGVVQGGNGSRLPITGGTAGAWQVLTPCARTAVVDGERIPGAHIVLDPGHGGQETGAISPTGVVESEINLDVARRTADHLTAAGATVVLTRDADIRVTIETRAAVAEALDPFLFVSIHHNGGPTRPSQQPGTQVFHQQDEPESTRLAGLLWEELRRALQPFSTTWSAGPATGVRARLGTDGTDFYGVLRGPEDVPSVLIEALYLSSEPEAELLRGSEIRDAEARAIADAIVAWVDTDRTGSGHRQPLVTDESAGGGGGAAGCDDPPLDEP